MSTTNDISIRDLTRYEFNNNEYIHCMLVAAVISDFVATHSNIAYQELCSIFPSQLQGEKGVFAPHDEIQKISTSAQQEEFLTGPCDSIQLADCTIHICTSWGVNNITRFIEHVLRLGYEISTVQSSYRLE